jgi:hypothetical protein
VAAKTEKTVGCFLMMLGVFEIVVYLLHDNIPFIIQPHAAVLWRSVFVESTALSAAFSLLMGIIVCSAGIAVVAGRRSVLISYLVIGTLVAIDDVYLPLAVMISGGSHVLDTRAAGIMLVSAVAYDVIPILFSIWLLIHSSSRSCLGAKM